jgi:hypothetical protein
MNEQQLKNTIMRRVYYSYTVSLVTNPMFWHGLIFSVAGLILADWLHVASIISNFLSVPVGGVPNYIIGSIGSALAGGQVMAVLLLAIVYLIFASSVYRFLKLFNISISTTSRV